MNLDEASRRATLTIEEAASLLGIGRGTAYEAARTGDLETIRMGRRLLVPAARLLRVLGIEDPSSNGDGSGGQPGHAEIVAEYPAKGPR